MVKLWKRLVATFAGLKDPHHPCTGKYMALLKPLHDESWKLPVRSALHEATGQVSATLFLLIFSVITNDVIKQKLFKIVTNITALGTGTIGASIHEGTMGELLKTVVIKILKVFPLICIALLSSSIVMLAVSLNPGVKWNEYTTDVWGFPTYYFSTLHSSVDFAIYTGSKNNHPCLSSYLPVLNPHHDESWKSPIQNGIYKTIGLNSGGFLLLIVGITLHGVTKQKLFTLAVDIGAVGAGITGGYFCLKAIKDYENGIYGAVAKRSRPYYFPEKENMEIGYNLAMYSAIMTIVASVLIIVYIGLYIPFGEGKWIWQRKTVILPDMEKSVPTETKTKSIPKKIGQQRKAKQTEGKMIKVKEYRSK